MIFEWRELSLFIFFFFYRYVLAVGLENGRIQLLRGIDMQWELWHELDER
jgi:hypothetical protein